MASAFIRELESARLRLRAVQPGDASGIFSSYGNDPEVARYMTWRHTGDLSDTESFVSAACRVWDTGEMEGPIGFNYPVFLKATNEMIGTIGFKPEHFKICVGYNYAKSHWRKGYATEALALLSDHLFGLAHVFRLWAYHDVENPASGRVLEKCGFSREGISKRAEIHPNISEEPRDCVIWAKTK